MRWWFVLGILLVAASVRAARLEIGPYLQQPSPDGTIVVFETDEHTSAEVIVETGQGVRRFPSAAGRHHEVRVSGLRAGRYHYRVAIGEVLSPIAELTTATTGQTFSFLVYGDNRDGHANHAQVVAAMSTHHPDFLINTGDLTSDGNVEPLWRRFFEIEMPLLSSVPLYPALGNHEVKNDRQASHYHRFFVLPGPPSIAAHERYYSFRYGNALFIALDSNESAHREQARWLRRTLDAARGDPAIHHRFVYFHHPPFSVGSECGSAIEQGLWVPLFEQYQVTAVFVGHEHAYEHMERSGIRYFVTGGGGAPIYAQQGNCPRYDRAALRLFRAEHHFLRVQVTGDLATLDAINMANVSIETVQLHLPAPPEPTPPPAVPYKQTPGPEPATMPLISSRPVPAPMLLLLVPIFIIAGMVLLLILLRRR